MTGFLVKVLFARSFTQLCSTIALSGKTETPNYFRWEPKTANKSTFPFQLKNFAIKSVGKKTVKPWIFHAINQHAIGASVVFERIERCKAKCKKTVKVPFFRQLCQWVEARIHYLIACMLSSDGFPARFNGLRQRSQLELWGWLPSKHRGLLKRVLGINYHVWTLPFSAVNWIPGCLATLAFYWKFGR